MYILSTLYKMMRLSFSKFSFYSEGMWFPKNPYATRTAFTPKLIYQFRNTYRKCDACIAFMTLALKFFLEEKNFWSISFVFSPKYL